MFLPPGRGCWLAPPQAVRGMTLPDPLTCSLASSNANVNALGVVIIIVVAGGTNAPVRLGLISIPRNLSLANDRDN